MYQTLLGLLAGDINPNFPHSFHDDGIEFARSSPALCASKNSPQI